jgi:predicted small lipoprotein YifL
MNHGQLSMKNVFPTLAVLFAIFSLTGCGLKGPLFPAGGKTAPPPTKPVNPVFRAQRRIVTIVAIPVVRARSITNDNVLFRATGVDDAVL